MKRSVFIFFMGVVFGLILSLWWRAAQINQNYYEPRIAEGENYGY